MISDPNPVLVETILSVSATIRERIVMHNTHFLYCFYFTSRDTITARVILPLAEHDWLK